MFSPWKIRNGVHAAPRNAVAQNAVALHRFRDDDADIPSRGKNLL
jgi:hypothetical protein